MATKVFCDLCDTYIVSGETIRVTVHDGEHPHSGSIMYKTIDVCFRCCKKSNIDLDSTDELDSLREKVK